MINMSQLRMFLSILIVQSAEKLTANSFLGQLIRILRFYNSQVQAYCYA